MISIFISEIIVSTFDVVLDFLSEMRFARLVVSDRVNCFLCSFLELYLSVFPVAEIANTGLLTLPPPESDFDSASDAESFRFSSLNDEVPVLVLDLSDLILANSLIDVKLSVPILVSYTPSTIMKSGTFRPFHVFCSEHHNNTIAFL